MQNSTTHMSFFEMSKAYVQNLFHRIKHSPDSILRLVLSFGIGFIIGFLLKKYANYVCALVFFIIGLIILQQFEWLSISFNTVKLESVFGIKSVPMSSDAVIMLWAWIKLNAVLSICFVIGLIMGLKIS